MDTRTMLRHLKIVEGCPYLIKSFCIYYQHIFTVLGETL